MRNYIKELPTDAKQYKNSYCWITPDGSVYGIETRHNASCRGSYFKYTTFINKHNGYVYTSVKYGLHDMRQTRVHRLVAELFLPNPFKLPVVGHKNNIKSDNRVDNLYWTTPKENTQKAVDDGLLVNAKGYEDSQSHPCIMFDTYTNKILGKYDSCSEASMCTNIPIGTIMRQCRYKRPVRKPFYFRFQDDESICPPRIVIQYDYFSDTEIGRYYNTWDASNKTGISDSTILAQCSSGKKPKTRTKSKSYFLYSYVDKCVETIENR